MNSVQKLERRVEVSADISDIVYNVEEYLARRPIPQTGTSVLNIENYLKENEIRLPQNTKIIDAMYDKKTGVAAIEVEDFHYSLARFFILHAESSRLFRTL